MTVTRMDMPATLCDNRDVMSDSSTGQIAAVDTVLVVDFGAQYAQLIARRVRECHVYSEIVPHTITADEIRAKAPKAVIMSGGPSSVYAEGAPQVAAGFFVIMAARMASSAINAA